MDICDVGSRRIQMLTLASDNTHQVRDDNQFPYSRAMKVSQLETRRDPQIYSGTFPQRINIFFFILKTKIYFLLKWKTINFFVLN